MGEAKQFGRYEVRQTIGRGAMGVVYLAEDPIIGRKVAIKVVEGHEGLGKEELAQVQARFEREFQSAGRLSHPNIVGVHDVGQENDRPFIAMEYVQGESLHAMLADNRAFSLQEVGDLAAQISCGLDYAHEFGIVHRDIKPGNILVTDEGRPKITDFGVARVETTTLTRTGTVVGTPAYMSPEQVTGQPVSGAADQFSLAVMVYQMLTGERPFSGENPTTIMYKIVHEEPVRPSALNLTLPAPADRVLMRALAKNPSARFSTCAEFGEALRDALAALPAAATVVMSTGEGAGVADRRLARPRRPVSRTDPARGLSIVTLAGIAFVLVAGAGVVAWRAGLLVGSLEGVGLVDGATASTLPVPVQPTPLAVVAAEGWEIWVDGIHTGKSTPDSIVLRGMQGDKVAVELRYGGNVLASQTFTLGADLPAQWSPVEGAPSGAAGAEQLADEVDGDNEAPATEQPVEVAPPVVLTIASNPPGATVTLNGTRLEEPTPVDVELDLAAQHSIAVQADGYDAAGLSFTGADLSEAQLADRRLDFPLTSSVPPGLFAIDNAYGYPIEITVVAQGGAGTQREYAAAAKHEIRLAPGRYEIRLQAPSVFWRETRYVTVESERTESFAPPRAVDVQISAVPGNCKVSIDGQFADVTPFPQRLTVGTHEFVFDWEDLGRGRVTVSKRISNDGQRIIEQARSPQ